MGRAEHDPVRGRTASADGDDGGAACVDAVLHDHAVTRVDEVGGVLEGAERPSARARAGVIARRGIDVVAHAVSCRPTVQAALRRQRERGHRELQRGAEEEGHDDALPLAARWGPRPSDDQKSSGAGLRPTPGTRFGPGAAAADLHRQRGTRAFKSSMELICSNIITTALRPEHPIKVVWNERERRPSVDGRRAAR